MRELPIPGEIAGDDRATEMIRVWLAHKDIKLSLLLGMWEDAEDCDIDERDAWGELLADIVQHIANGLSQSHGWDKKQTIVRITNSFFKNTKCPIGVVEGNYIE